MELRGGATHRRILLGQSSQDDGLHVGPPPRNDPPMLRRDFLKTASVAAIAPWAAAHALARSAGAQAQAGSLRMIIDADTANEIDDLYALVRALLEPRFDIAGISSAQWNHRLSPPDTVLWSQRLNEEILGMMGRRDIPTPMGAEMIMGKPWGGDEPRDSPAARLMITQARQMPAGQKLVIASLGAATNVASAIKLAPDIVPRISCYVLAGRYHADRRVWDKDEFNLRNDLNAANFLFNTEGLELHLMPVNILLDFRFQRDEVVRRLSTRGTIWDYLVSRWISHSPASESWIMWDLALIQAIARPELATEAMVTTPPENRQRDIHVYTAIDRDGMLRDWWEMFEGALARAPAGV
jgi:purine nucleosidase